MTASPAKVLRRLAHVSDLHFAHPSWNPSQLLSKRWLGNLNLLLARRHTFNPDHLTTLFPLFHEKKIDTVLVTGDLSCTSDRREFLLAQQFIENLHHEGFQVCVLPGNHDHYTRAAFSQKLFYEFFPDRYQEDSRYSLKEEGLTVLSLAPKWWLIGLDTAIATSLLSSNGLFSVELERHLTTALSQIPQGDQVLLMNHFPLFANDSFRKSLWRKEALKQLLERFPQIKLYLHGHSHRHCIADLRASRLPVVLDSGSTGLKHHGSWNYIELTDQGCAVEGFRNQYRAGYTFWEPFIKSQFDWGHHETVV